MRSPGAVALAATAIPLVLATGVVVKRPRGLSFEGRSASPDYHAAPRHLRGAYTIAENIGLYRSRDEIDGNYPEFVNNVLMIRDVRDPDLFDLEHGKFGFVNLAAKALCLPSQPCLPNVQPALSAWADQNFSGLSGFKHSWDRTPGRPLGKLPLHLLAVVPRFDLAAIDERGNASGAELRFAYAGVDPDSENPLRFAWILEFKLRKFEPAAFSKLVGDWAGLATRSSNLAEVLRDTLATAEATRIRVNGAAGATWHFSQFQISAGSIVPENLFRQPNEDGSCFKPASPLGKFLISPGAARSVLAVDYDLDRSIPNLVSQEAKLPERRDPVLTLDRSAVPAPHDPESVRFILSINSCAGCHGPEGQGGFDGADIGFDHIKYRKGNPANLSRFLTGCSATNGCEPGGPGSPRDLWRVNPRPALGCDHAPTASRKYNDLLRRRLYFEVILKKEPSVWKEKLEEYKLIALQPH